MTWSIVVKLPVRPMITYNVSVNSKPDHPGDSQMLVAVGVGFWLNRVIIFIQFCRGVLKDKKQSRTTYAIGYRLTE